MIIRWLPIIACASCMVAITFMPEADRHSVVAQEEPPRGPVPPPAATAPCECTTWESRIARVKVERAELRKRWEAMDQECKNLAKEIDWHVAKYGRSVLHPLPVAPRPKPEV